MDKQIETIGNVVEGVIGCRHPSEAVQVLAKTGGWFSAAGRVEWCAWCGAARTIGGSGNARWARIGAALMLDRIGALATLRSWPSTG